MSKTLQPADLDARLIESLLKNGTSEVFTKKVSMLDGKAKKKPEERLFLLTTHRVYSIKAAEKRNDKPTVVNESHLLEVHEISTPSDNSVLIKTKNVTYHLQDLSVDVIDELVALMYSLYCQNIPHLPSDKMPSFVTNSDRLEEDAIDFDDLACDQFARTYYFLCDLVGTKPASDVAWDVNNIYENNGVVNFDLSDIMLRKDPLTKPDFKPLLSALRFNQYFNGFSVRNSNRLGNEFAALTAPVLSNNTTMTKFQLRKIGMTKDAMKEIGNAIMDNPGSKLAEIDFSDNTIEDAGISHLLGALQTLSVNLTALHFNNIGTKKTGMQNLLKGLQNKANNLDTLELSNNKFDAEACKLLGALINSSPHLKTLKVSNCGLTYQNIAGGITLKHKLYDLDISQNQLAKNNTIVDLLTLLRHIPTLYSLNVADINLTENNIHTLMKDESVKAVEVLNVSDNDLGDAGIAVLFDDLNVDKIVKELHFDRCVRKKTNLRPKAIAAIQDMLQQEDCKLEVLSIQGTPKSTFKEDIVPIIYALVSHPRLVQLDISGNHAGNGVGHALGKVLSTNEKLRVIKCDENDMSLIGYKMINAGVNRNCSLQMFSFPVKDVFAAIHKDKTTEEPITEILNQIQATCLSHTKPAKPAKPGKKASQREVVVDHTADAHQQSSVYRTTSHGAQSQAPSSPPGKVSHNPSDAEIPPPQKAAPPQTPTAAAQPPPTKPKPPPTPSKPTQYMQHGLVSAEARKAAEKDGSEPQAQYVKLPQFNAKDIAQKRAGGRKHIGSPDLRLGSKRASLVFENQDWTDQAEVGFN